MTETKLHLYRVFILPIVLHGFECWESTRRTYSELMHWTSGVNEESLTFIGMILSQMLTFVVRPISHHSHPLSSLVVFFSLHIVQEWMRMQTPVKSFLSLLPRAGQVHLGGLVLAG